MNEIKRFHAPPALIASRRRPLLLSRPAAAPSRKSMSKHNRSTASWFFLKQKSFI
jgi:hypothetical protein